MNGPSTDEMSRPGRTLMGTVHRSTRSRSLRVSLSSRNKQRGETASLTIQLENPDEMIEKVLQVLSARFPVDAFFNVIAEQHEFQWVQQHQQSSNQHLILAQALQNPVTVAQILPEELRSQWLAYAASAQMQQVTAVDQMSVQQPPSRVVYQREAQSMYSSSSSRENTAGVAVVQPMVESTYSMHQDTTTSMEANSSTISIAHDHHDLSSSQPQLGTIVGAANQATYHLDANTLYSQVSSSHAAEVCPAGEVQVAVAPTSTTTEEQIYSVATDTAAEVMLSTAPVTNTTTVTETTQVQHHDVEAVAADHHQLISASPPAALTATYTDIAYTQPITTMEHGTVDHQAAHHTIDQQVSHHHTVTEAVQPSSITEKATVNTMNTTYTAPVLQHQAPATQQMMSAEYHHQSTNYAQQTMMEPQLVDHHVTAHPVVETTTTTTTYAQQAPLQSHETNMTQMMTAEYSSKPETVAAVAMQSAAAVTANLHGGISKSTEAHNVVDTIHYITPSTTEVQSSKYVVDTVNYVPPRTYMAGSTNQMTTQESIKDSTIIRPMLQSPFCDIAQSSTAHHQTTTGVSLTGIGSMEMTDDYQKTMQTSVSMCVQPSTSPKLMSQNSMLTAHDDLLATESLQMGAVTSLMHQTTQEETTFTMMNHPDGGARSNSASEGNPSIPSVINDRQPSVKSSSSHSSAKPINEMMTATVVETVQDFAVVGDTSTSVFNGEGKWQTWRDDLADKETEHSAKSGSVSQNDDSSFHETTVEFTESALRHTAEILHQHGCLQQLLLLDASSPIYQQTLHTISAETDVDLGMIHQVFNFSRLRAEFLLWCEAMYKPSPSVRQHTETATLATTQTMPVVTRDFQVMDNQLVHTLASPVMTVRTTVSIEPGLLQNHTATTTTVLHRNGEEWTRDTRAVGHLTVTSPIEKPSHFAIAEATPLAAAAGETIVAPLSLHAASAQFVMSSAHAQIANDQASPLSAVSITPTGVAEPDAAAVMAAYQHRASLSKQSSNVEAVGIISATEMVTTDLVTSRQISLGAPSIHSQTSQNTASYLTASHHNVPVNSASPIRSMSPHQTASHHTQSVRAGSIGGGSELSFSDYSGAIGGGNCMFARLMMSRSGTVQLTEQSEAVVDRTHDKQSGAINTETANAMHTVETSNQIRQANVCGGMTVATSVPERLTRDIIPAPSPVEVANTKSTRRLETMESIGPAAMYTQLASVETAHPPTAATATATEGTSSQLMAHAVVPEPTVVASMEHQTSSHQQTTTHHKAEPIVSASYQQTTQYAAEPSVRSTQELKTAHEPIVSASYQQTTQCTTEPSVTVETTHYAASPVVTTQYTTEPVVSASYQQTTQYTTEPSVAAESSHCAVPPVTSQFTIDYPVSSSYQQTAQYTSEAAAAVKIGHYAVPPITTHSTIEPVVSTSYQQTTQYITEPSVTVETSHHAASPVVTTQYTTEPVVSASYQQTTEYRTEPSVAVETSHYAPKPTVTSETYQQTTTTQYASEPVAVAGVYHRTSEYNTGAAAQVSHDTMVTSTVPTTYHQSVVTETSTAHAPVITSYEQQPMLQRVPSAGSRHTERSKHTSKSSKSHKSFTTEPSRHTEKSGPSVQASQKSVESRKSTHQSERSAAVISASGSVNANVRMMSQSSHSASQSMRVQPIAATVVPTGAQLCQAAGMIAQQTTVHQTIAQQTTPHRTIVHPTTAAQQMSGNQQVTTTFTTQSTSPKPISRERAAEIAEQLRQQGMWKLETAGATVMGGVRQLSGSSHPSFEMQVDVVEDTDGRVTDSSAAMMVMQAAQKSAMLTETYRSGQTSTPAMMESSSSGSPITVTRTVVYPKGQPSSNTFVDNVTHNVASWSSVLPQQSREIVYLQSSTPRQERAVAGVTSSTTVTKSSGAQTTGGLQGTTGMAGKVTMGGVALQSGASSISVQGGLPGMSLQGVVSGVSGVTMQGGSGLSMGGGASGLSIQGAVGGSGAATMGTHSGVSGSMMQQSGTTVSGIFVPPPRILHPAPMQMSGSGAHTTTAATSKIIEESRIGGISRQYSQTSSPLAAHANSGWRTMTHDMSRTRDVMTQPSTIPPLQMQTRSTGGSSSMQYNSSTLHMTQPMMPQNMIYRASSPLAASIGHDRFFTPSTHRSGAATTGHITTTTTTRGMVAADTSPSTYVAYNEWKSANMGVGGGAESSQHSLSKQTTSKSQHSMSVVSSKYAAPAATAQINTGSPLAQLKQENANPLLEKLAQHWTR